MKYICAILSFLVGLTCAAYAAAPEIRNLRAVPRAEEPVVDIRYDVHDQEGDALAIDLAASTNGGASYDVPRRMPRAISAPPCSRERTSTSFGTPGWICHP